MHSLVVLFVMLLSVCVVISLGRRLVSWCIIEIQDTNMSFWMLFTAIKQGMFESIQTSQELQAANLLQVAVGEAEADIRRSVVHFWGDD